MTTAPARFRHLAVPHWLILLAVALAARTVTFGNPIVHVDEQFYFVTARAMLDGALPYVDIWDRKPVGLFALYLPAAAIGWPGGILAYQVMALACAIATAVLIGTLARRAGWARGALVAGILYLLWLNFAEGQGGQAPVFYNLFVVGAVGLLSGGVGFPRTLGAMLLLGLGLQIKYSVAFEGAALGCWVLWQRRSDPIAAQAARAAAMLAVALAPTALVWTSYAAIGQADAFAFANFWSILARTRDPIGEQAGNLAIVALILAPLLAFAWAGRHGGGAEGASARGLLHLWLIAALAGLLAFGGWFDHYALPAIAAACGCAAGFFAGERRTARATGLLLVAMFAGGQTVLQVKRHERGTPAQFAALAGAVGGAPGCLLVYSGPTMLYPATGRCRVSAFVFPGHLGRTREAGAIGMAQEAAVRAALARRPDRIVVQAGYRGERPDIRALLVDTLACGYRPIGSFPLGTRQVTAYRRSNVAASCRT